MKTIYDDLVKLTTTKDEKAELTLVASLEDKPRQEKRQICKFLDCPWEEYQRLRKKYARVLERWNAENGELRYMSTILLICLRQDEHVARK